MDLYCTRPGCVKPINPFPDLDDPETLKAVQQKYCTTCGMPLILVGRYLPLKLLGQGGFGAAFLACDRHSPRKRPCVVKQFQPSTHLSPIQLQMAQELFEREAQTLEDLGNPHPQIPDLYAFFELSVNTQPTGQTVKFFYLAQEFIDGQTLEEELAQTGAFSSQAVLEVLRETLKILQFVHDNGVIHRDIKPSNIMRHRNGQIYLLDFGAVRQATKGATKSTGIYSEGFAPPEQMSGGAVFPSTDLYALAVTCVMLLTNRQPSDLYDSFTNTWRWRPYATATEPILANVLDRMLCLSPSARYHSAQDGLNALQSSPQMPPSAKQASPRKTAPAIAPPPTTLPNSSPPTSIQPQAHSPAAQPVPVKPGVRQPAIAPFSTLELLASAGFTGFQAGLLGIALASVLGTTLISSSFWLVLVLGLVVAQARRWIERADLPILAGTSLALMLLVSPLRQAITVAIAGSSLVTVVVVAIATGFAAILGTALFRLLYNVLSRFI